MKMKPGDADFDEKAAKLKKLSAIGGFAISRETAEAAVRRANPRPVRTRRQSRSDPMGKKDFEGFAVLFLQPVGGGSCVSQGSSR